MDGGSEQAGPSGAPVPRDAVDDALMSLPEAEAQHAWQQLPPEALLAEVAKYRGAIRDVASRLRVLGEPKLPPPSADHLLTLSRREAGAGGNGPTASPLPHSGATGAAGAFCAPGAQAGGIPADDGAEADPELAHLGEEGTDYVLGSVDDVDPSEWQVPPHCVPIHANVTTFDWPSLYEQCQFDVIMMDPPWQLATANPTRGVALGYSQLNDDHISSLPVPQLQRAGGFLFVWVINAKYKWTLDLFDKWGYRLVDEVVWVKMTVNRRLAKSHGYYLQHAKEVCLVAKRGNPLALAGSPSGFQGVGSDIIFSERRGQSQKPEEIYELVEQLVPNGRYLEIFARKNNLRNYWVSIGNEVTGTGLPDDDLRAMREMNRIPGAVYGKNGGGGGGGAAGGGRASSGGSGGGAAASERSGGGGGRRGPSPAPGGGTRQSSGGSGPGGGRAQKPPLPLAVQGRLQPAEAAGAEAPASNVGLVAVGAVAAAPPPQQQQLPTAPTPPPGGSGGAVAPTGLTPGGGGCTPLGRASLGVSGLGGGLLPGLDDHMDTDGFGAGVGMGLSQEQEWT
ncbi:hypothetical protein GPECTOR_41g730 [Gonium pectorale]|uniref:mRNA m(6)A methyltransferase n=1 Tax=Gonium pectorale TaxID=33097 RepID=A0A150GB05_GONPE|nr:hypothetical protein GPECTOR_41g730 [Gonium pectorale]|eukprot:KXZ46765.1 hypothetical protein GPECTOR_41g730 [Gonium pectorale]